MRFQIKKFLVLSDFKTKFLQCLMFQIKFFTSHQILKQKFHDVSDFISKVLQRVNVCFKTFLEKSGFEQKYALKKLRFD